MTKTSAGPPTTVTYQCCLNGNASIIIKYYHNVKRMHPVLSAVLLLILKVDVVASIFVLRTGSTIHDLLPSLCTQATINDVLLS